MAFEMSLWEVDEKVLKTVSSSKLDFERRLEGRAVPMNEFENKDEKSLLEQPLMAPKAGENTDDQELSDWVVGMRWERIFDRKDAEWFQGAFANQNIVCKLRDPKTLAFLQREFGVE
ncbi:MAG: hypothetical protein ACE5JX_10310 [Acidobacteriota bacterium]